MCSLDSSTKADSKQRMKDLMPEVGVGGSDALVKREFIFRCRLRSFTSFILVGFFSFVEGNKAKCTLLTFTYFNTAGVKLLDLIGLVRFWIALCSFLEGIHSMLSSFRDLTNPFSSTTTVGGRTG